MKEIRQIVQIYDKSETELGVLLTVIKVEGSSYRRTGARMFLTESGEWVGGISGGCLEADALKKAQVVLFQKKPRILIYDTTDDDSMQIGIGLGCNGIIHILVSPIDRKNKNNALEVIKKTLNEREFNVLYTVLDNEKLGDTFLNDQFEFHNLINCDNLKNEIKEFNVEDVLIKVLVEKIKPEIRFLIFGNNADVNPMAKFASELGWQIEIIGNSNKLSNETKEITDKLYPKGTHPEIDNFTVAISMCHDFETDFANFNYLIQTKIKYIGLLGPKKRFEKMISRLEIEDNLEKTKNLKVVYAPAGIDIGAEAPEQIALSVCSEIITVLAGRSAGFLKDRSLPIYQE